jgi:hypothetical protein
MTCMTIAPSIPILTEETLFQSSPQPPEPIEIPSSLARPFRSPPEPQSRLPSQSTCCAISGARNPRLPETQRPLFTRIWRTFHEDWTLGRRVSGMPASQGWGLPMTKWRRKNVWRVVRLSDGREMVLDLTQPKARALAATFGRWFPGDKYTAGRVIACAPIPL